MEINSIYRYNGSENFRINEFDTAATGKYSSQSDIMNLFSKNRKDILSLQQALYAQRKDGVIFIFQAMDAAGKDGVIRTVFSTLSPHGVKEYCFKAPSAEEQSHDFLWRFWNALPSRGNISIFNRSYYESVLIEKVHKLWENQNLPDRCKNKNIIQNRYAQIRGFENYLYETGTKTVKIFLNVSKEEQAKRFVSRIESPKKNWKLSANDIAEREYWDEYMSSFETMINETATENSPWFVVPADHKWFARFLVSEIVLETLREIKPEYPEISEEEQNFVNRMKENLLKESGGKRFETANGILESQFGQNRLKNKKL